MEIVALQQYTDKHVSLYQGEIRNINKELADRLIEKGIVAEHNEESGGIPSDGGDVLVVHVEVANQSTVTSVDKTWAEMLAAVKAGKALLANMHLQSSYGDDGAFVTMAMYLDTGYETAVGSRYYLYGSSTTKATLYEYQLTLHSSGGGTYSQNSYTMQKG